MKLIIIALLALVSVSSFAVTLPTVETSVNEGHVVLTLTNNEDVNLNCHYSVSWFVNTLNFRKEFGNISLAANSASAVSFKNDIYDHIAHVRAKVTCE